MTERARRSSLSLLALACLLACGQSSEAEGNETDDGFGLACPDARPQVDDPCEQLYATCTYMSCADYGVATATCRDDRRWDLDLRPCEQLDCQQETCAPGLICVRTSAGIPSGSCVENTCGEGPIGCACPGCGEHDCTANGLTVECNACQAQVCP